MSGWAFMWTTAAAIYGGCKWLTFREARASGASFAPGRAFGYLVAWPGMDAGAFLSSATRRTAPSRSQWIVAALKTLAGATLIWVIARRALPDRPLLAGWIGMAGMILVLLFGTFDLLSLGWQRVGVNATPVMRSPLRSTSLAEFWGRRWNTAFHELATLFSYKPLRSIAGTAGATLLTFLVSGLIHELVISVPAHGGYGMPTGYFVLQGLGVAGERSRRGRRFGLGRGVRGRLFMMLVVAGPVFWLFPPPFVRNVVLPMLAAIGAA